MTLDDTFVSNPTQDVFDKLTRDQLLRVATHYQVEITSASQRNKAAIKAALQTALVAKNFLPEKKDSVVTAAMEHQIRLEELAIREKELECERERLLAQSREEEARLAVHKLELEAQMAAPPAPRPFDITRHIKLVPPFVEKDVEKYFPHFEHVASNLKWPKASWAFLLQRVLVGKSQEVYSSLSVEQRGDYDQANEAILKAYQLVPEAYRQKFRNLKKNYRQTYVEFGKDKETLFDRWSESQLADSREKLRDLIILEELKKLLAPVVATYVTEQKAVTVAEAAVLADEYVLVHNFTKDCFRFRARTSGMSDSEEKQNVQVKKEDRQCFYCKKPGHVVVECLILNKKQSAKPVILVNSPKSQLPDCQVDLQSNKTQSLYEPFLTNGTVFVPGEMAVPVRILRDTGAVLSILQKGVETLLAQTSTGSSALVRGIEMGYIEVLLHRVHLKSDLFSGEVVVGVRDSLPIPGVTLWQ